jgi:diguanylate cyclase (GGDEF)-like protein
MKSKLPLIRTMQFGFGVVVAVLLVVWIVAYRSVVASTTSARWAQHTSEVLEHLAKLRSTTENMESGYRDFALSGDDAFLQLAADGVALVDRQQSTLRALTADNANQQRRLGIIADSIQRIIQRGETMVRLRRTGGPETVADVLRKAHGDPILDELRAVARDMGDEERQLLNQRNADTERRYRQTKIAIIAGSALALLIAAVSGWMVPRDYTERLEAQDNLKRLNRVYAMVSGINALMVRVRNRDELFSTVCRIAVEHGEFEMAWIGMAEHSERKIVLTASAGLDEQTMAAIKDVFSTSEGTLQGKTLAARAIRQKAAIVSNDVRSDESLVLGKMHSDSGIRSIAVLPLIVAERAIGVFVLYTSKREFFEAEGLVLLKELAGNVAFAIDHIEKQEQLDRFAYYDALTGLANRSLFLDRVTQYMRSAARDGHQLAVFLIDLERFKKFNDSVGRPAGDALLKQVAEWLAQNVGDVNVLARVGADHFAAVLREVTNEADVARLLERTIAAFLNHPFSLNEVVYRIAAKVGVALFPDDGADADTLFKNAEAALKKAKVSGDRYLFYAPKMTDTVAGSLGLENRLRHALEREEFVLHYQPKVNLASGKLTGAEALIRWNDPQGGLVAPARFIPILEETRLIHEVGRWALRKAIEDYQRWRKAGLPAVRIAVNVSPLQLRNRSFVAELEEILRIAPDTAAGLELEITESLIMEDVNHSIVSLRAIRALGIIIAIDDFGTGFSSLSYLSKLPVDTVKIDRSFIVDMLSGADGLTLVSVIINLAHALKLNVVAEGVETAEQLRQLQVLNCDEMQGYLFGKPVPSEIFEKKYLARSASQAALG